MIGKLKTILAEYVDMEGITFTEDTVLLTDIGLSSLDYFELVTRLEEEFSVRISDSELFSLHTVGDIITCINSKQ